ncbi:hypothetical protein ALC57_08300 [Trachymyrmex cornetzi]|uniref:YqaJ viral recombinase domain-containing protein n=1 Tax=Trachymyrmex cornetzi TaxID=471704 RepID=A0A151J7G0_9HYME|nr:hypothetical protein ALC57_08300 [Trachymyrmex cornetzi]
MIADYFINNECYNVAESSGAKIKRSERVNYGDSAVGYVQLKRDGNICTVQGKVCPEHRVNSKAYIVKMLVDEGDEKVIEVKCQDCAASEATVCYWKKSRLAQVSDNVRNIKAKDMVKVKCQTNNKSNYDPDDFYNSLLVEFQTHQFDCQLSRHCIDLKVRHPLSLHEIYGRLTASRLHEMAHCGVSSEKKVIKVLEEKNKLSLGSCGLLLNPEFPVIGASPDAVGEHFVVEIKCPMTLKTERAYITSDMKLGNKCFAQIQLQMFLRNVQKGLFCMAKHDFESTHEIITVWVDYDDIYVQNLIQKAMIFWKSNIFPLLLKTVQS